MSASSQHAEKGSYEDTQPGGVAWDWAVDLYARLSGGAEAP